MIQPIKKTLSLDNETIRLITEYGSKVGTNSISATVRIIARTFLQDESKINTKDS